MKKLSSNNPLDQDLEQILTLTSNLWEEIRGKRLFITGGTGFFGRWFLESFVYANQKLELGAEAVVLTRDLKSFKSQAPHLASNPAIKFHRGDIRHFTFPAGRFNHIIHAAATSAIAAFNREDPLVNFDTIVYGTRRALEFAASSGAEKLLFTSSGAIYGKQPPDMVRIPEDYSGAIDPMTQDSAYAEGKRAAEFLCAYFAKKRGLEIKVARCFSFVGPFLPLDVHYAIGNFIRDGLEGGPIQVNGDGTPHRSYLYTADLMVWLWTILFKGQSLYPYNVGSEDGLSISELAQLVAQSFGDKVKVIIAKSPAGDALPQRYVPSTERASKELGLKQTIDLKEALRRTIAYCRSI